MTKNAQTGYGRPPVDHQFTPGQSGNPAGRPKGARSFTSDLRAELEELISVSDGATFVEVTKQRAVVKMMVRRAIAGDPRAIASIVAVCAKDDTADEAEEPEDAAILKATAVASPKRRSPTSTADGG